MIQVLGIFGFLSFGWADVLDILMVAVIIYLLFRKAMRFYRSTGS